MENKQLYVFDFDGTIADSVPAALRIINDLGAEYRLPKVDPQIIAELKHKSIKELLHMSGLTWVQIPGFLRKARLGFRKMIDDVKPIEGMPALIHHLVESNARLGILTSNREDNVRDFLQKHDLEQFDFVECSTSLFGKANKLRRIKRMTGIPFQSMAMIGDEVRDVEAAKKVGVTSVAVTWGFNSPELLQTSHPDHLVSSTEGLDHLLRFSSSAGAR
ncbi:MAG: HAD-IA family hydrolase [Bacteroidia bacterium]|nr:HAD-IA family hydrolase [Bacteroidia bacterium]